MKKNKLKIPIIEHESFVSLFLKNPNIYKILFGPNRNGEPVTKLDTLTGRIYRLCEKLMPEYADMYPDQYNKPGTGLDKFKGEVYEIFMNGLLLLKGSDARVGVADYKPVKSHDDHGVDGIGKGMDGKNLTVQIKYRSDPRHQLTQTELKQFWGISFAAYGVEVTTSDNILLISSCFGLHPLTAAKTFGGQIREINAETTRNIVDGNTIFWNDFQTLIDNSIKVLFGDEIFKQVIDMNSELCEE